MQLSEMNFQESDMDLLLDFFADSRKTYKGSPSHILVLVCPSSQPQVMFSPSVDSVQNVCPSLNGISRSLQPILRRTEQSIGIRGLFINSESDAFQFHLKKAINLIGLEWIY